MLGSVIGAVAVNMVVVQSISYVSISMACSIVSAPVLRTVSPEPRPVGITKGRDKAGSSLEPVSSARMKHRSIERKSL